MFKWPTFKPNHRLCYWQQLKTLAIQKFRIIKRVAGLFCTYFLVVALKINVSCFCRVTLIFSTLGLLNCAAPFVLFFACVDSWPPSDIITLFDQILRIISRSSRPGSALRDKVNCLIVFLTGAINCALNIWDGLKAIDLPHRPWTTQTCCRWPSLNHNARRIIRKTPAVAKWLLQNVVFFARQQNLWHCLRELGRRINNAVVQLTEWYRALNSHGNYDALRFLGSNSGTAKSATFYSISSGPLLITQLSGTTIKHLKRHYCRGETIYSSDSICSSKLLFGRAESGLFFLNKLSMIFCFPPVHKA